MLLREPLRLLDSPVTASAADYYRGVSRKRAPNLLCPGTSKGRFPTRKVTDDSSEDVQSVVSLCRVCIVLARLG